MDERSDIMHGDRLYEGRSGSTVGPVPWDIESIIELMGGKEPFTTQLEQFFDGDLYNHGNQPDIRRPFSISATNLAHPGTGKQKNSPGDMTQYTEPTKVGTAFTEDYKGRARGTSRKWTMMPARCPLVCTGFYGLVPGVRWAARYQLVRRYSINNHPPAQREKNNHQSKNDG